MIQRYKEKTAEVRSIPRSNYLHSITINLSLLNFVAKPISFFGHMKFVLIGQQISDENWTEMIVASMCQMLNFIHDIYILF